MKHINVWQLCPEALKNSLHPIARSRGNLFHAAHSRFGLIYTDFYIQNIKRIKKYLLFGPTVEIKRYERVFDVDFDIEQPKYSMTEVQDAIGKKLKMYSDIEDRKMQIASGKII